MTVDFRNPDQTLLTAESRLALAAPQRVVLFILGVTGLALLLAGVWMLLFPVPWFKPNVAPMIALALILSGVGDACAMLFLRWSWLRAARRS